VRTDFDEEFTAGRLGVLLGLLMLGLFPEIILGSHAFFYRDAGLFGYPLAYYFRDCAWRGEIPLWNPYNDCGIPFLAQWNTMTLYPFSIFYLVLPMPWSLNFFILGHVFLAAFGMYRLAYYWFGNRFAASVAGLAFAWSGLTLHSLMWPNNIAALGWMPWIVWHCERARQEGGRRIIFAALAGASQMLAGAPEIIMITWLIVGGVLLTQSWREKRLLLTSTVRLGIIVVIIIGLSAVQLLPWADFVKHGQRDSSFDQGGWSLPPWGAANFLVPLFHSTQSVTGVFTQPEQEWTSSYYAGIVILVLAVIAVLKFRERKTIGLALISVVGVFCALGSPGMILGPLRAIVPLLGFMRYPIKFIVLTLFCLPLLAASAIVWMSQQEHFVSRKTLIKCSALAAFGALVVLVAAFLFPFPEDVWKSTWQNGAARILVLVVAIAIVFYHQKSEGKAAMLALSFGFLALIGLDVSTHAPRQNPVVITRGYERHKLEMTRGPQLGESRAMLSHYVSTITGRMFHPYPLNMYLGERAILMQDCNLLEKIPKVDGFYSIHLREEQQILSLVATNILPVPLTSFLGISQLTSDEHLFWWNERTNFMPMATIGQQPVFADEKVVLKALASNEFRPSQQVFLPTETRGIVSATNDAAARILSSETAAHKCTYITHTTNRTMLVIAQCYYHNWKASLDGRPVPLLRANHAFQAVEVPSGRHEVRLVYVDRKFQIGAAISLTTLLASLICFFIFPARPAQPA